MILVPAILIEILAAILSATGMAGAAEISRRLTSAFVQRRRGPEEGGTRESAVVDTKVRLGRNAYTAATLVATIATVLGVVVLFVVGAPTAESAPSFEQFFAAGAQVLVGLLIALAIELRGAGLVTREGRARFEVLLALTWIGLGLALALVALLPDCPEVVLSVSAVTVPATVLGALTAIVSLVSVAPTEEPSDR